MSHHSNPLNDVCLEHIYLTFELLGQFNNLEANSRALMLKVKTKINYHNNYFKYNKYL